MHAVYALTGTSTVIMHGWDVRAPQTGSSCAFRISSTMRFVISVIP
jgi:hypothetical protein